MQSDGGKRSDEGRAGWRDWLGHFRHEIREGRILPGSRLPSLAELQADYGLTRFGARKLIDTMREEGLAQSWHGRGSYVAERPIHYRISPLTRFSANASREGRTSRADLLDRGERKAQGRVARMLGVAPGTRLPYAVLLGYLDDRPAVLARHSFAPDLGGDILAVLDHCQGSIGRALADVGHAEFRRTTTLIEARLPTRHEALTLDVPPSQPVLVTTALNVAAGQDRKLELSQAVARADLIAFEVPDSGA
ncbi:GntR family transcriptional regulator [Marinibacterium sp. SX1]|uniref:GntR family transcriptional regulator n=1 Tax=Marinibacterium sp. SX1 TaxID=3388424 RepID=UPI003D172837